MPAKLSFFLEQVTDSDIVDVVEIAIKHHASDLTTKAMALIALLKLSSRFPSCSEYVFSVPSIPCNSIRLMFFYHRGTAFFLSCIKRMRFQLLV